MNRDRPRDCTALDQAWNRKKQFLKTLHKLKTQWVKLTGREPGFYENSGSFVYKEDFSLFAQWVERTQGFRVIVKKGVVIDDYVITDPKLYALHLLRYG